MTAVPATSRGESPASNADPLDLLDRLLELPSRDAGALAHHVTILLAEALPSTVAGIFRREPDDSFRLFASPNPERLGADLLSLIHI